MVFLARRGDRLKMNGRVYRIHRVRYGRDTILVYGWRDVVATEIACASVARVKGAA